MKCSEYPVPFIAPLNSPDSSERPVSVQESLPAWLLLSCVLSHVGDEGAWVFR